MIFKLLRPYKSSAKKIQYLLTAIENNDYAFKFSEVKGLKFEKIFNTTLNKIKDVLTEERKKIQEKEAYYELILENVITGIVVIDDKNEVVFCNSKALNMLSLPMLGSLVQLKHIDVNLPGTFRNLTPEKDVTISFSNERLTINLSLKASYVTLNSRKMKVVALNDITKELEDKETESWERLTHVMTHEIMNLVAPISSLTDTMLQIYSNENENLVLGLETISNTSKSLISFVESYRKFSGIPKPNKEVFELKPFFQKIITLLNSDISALGVTTIVNIVDGIKIEADETQIHQLAVNIIKNGLYAMKERKNPVLIIDAYNSKNGVIINISNNGTPISQEEKAQIFIPFFTSKRDGSGIGLSVSRQIMRLHGGTIKLKSSDVNKTTFSLTFIK